MPTATAKPKRAAADKATGQQQRDTSTTCDFVAEYMHEHCRALSIDTLLTRPLDAMKMGLNVAARAQRISERTAASIQKLLASIEKENPQAVDEIDRVCRVALNGRKQGGLKRDRY